MSTISEYELPEGHELGVYSDDLADMFPSFPALEIPLGDFVDVDGLNNAVWTLDEVEVEMHDSGWVKLTAGLGEQ